VRGDHELGTPQLFNVFEIFDHTGFWPCSGRLHVVVLYFVLSLLAHFAFWSRIVSGLNQERT
jgi:hypothetical protein